MTGVVVRFVGLEVMMTGCCQVCGLAAGSAGRHRSSVRHVPAGHLLSVGVTIPSPAEGDTPSEKPETQGQGQKDSEQGRKTRK